MREQKVLSVLCKIHLGGTYIQYICSALFTDYHFISSDFNKNNKRRPTFNFGFKRNNKVRFWPASINCSHSRQITCQINGVLHGFSRFCDLNHIFADLIFRKNILKQHVSCHLAVSSKNFYQCTTFLIYLLIYGDIKVKNHVKYIQTFCSPYRPPT